MSVTINCKYSSVVNEHERECANPGADAADLRRTQQSVNW